MTEAYPRDKWGRRPSGRRPDLARPRPGRPKTTGPAGRHFTVSFALATLACVLPARSVA